LRFVDIIVALLASVGLIVPGLDGFSRIRQGATGLRIRIAVGALLALGCGGLVVSGWLIVDLFRQMQAFGEIDFAINAMRVVVVAEAEFAETHPERGYTCTLSDLRTDELSPEFWNTGRMNGYTFDITGCRTEGQEKQNLTYQVTAQPQHVGMPAFCSDQSGIRRSDDSGSASKCLEAGQPW
jgi:hypothetical protein